MAVIYNLQPIAVVSYLACIPCLEHGYIAEVARTDNAIIGARNGCGRPEAHAGKSIAIGAVATLRMRTQHRSLVERRSLANLVPIVSYLLVPRRTRSGTSNIILLYSWYITSVLM